MLDFALIRRLFDAPAFESEAEIQEIRRIRNAVCYDGYVNSLISWMLSEEWEIPTSRGSELTECSGTIEINPTQEDR